MFATLPALLCTPVEGVDAGDASSPAVASSPPPGQEDAKRWFLERYAKAYARLGADASPLHGKVRRRQSRGSEPGEWTTIEFFVEDANVRLQREYGTLDGGGRAKPPDAMLLTREAAATVVDPGTEFAWATYLSDAPDRQFEHEIFVHLWRPLRASYYFAKTPLSDHLASDLTIESVETDPMNDGLLHVRCRRAASGTDSGAFKNATVDIWLDATHDFVIRKSRAVYEKPSSLLEFGTDASSYVPLPNGGWLPSAYSESVYSTATTPAAASGPSSNGRVLIQRLEYELLGPVHTEDIPDSYFKLESLGVYPASRHLKWWLLIGVSVAVLLIVLLATRKNRPSGSATAAGEGPAP
ncbi:MAG: hypothetical protein ACREHD_13630 [Pirellulales bacterium]